MRAVLVALAAALAATAAEPPKPPVRDEGKPRAEDRREPGADGWGPVRNYGKADGLLYAVSPDGNEMVIRPYADAVTLLDLRTGKVRRVEGKFGGHLGAISYSPDGKLVACAEWQNGATIRDAKTWGVMDHITPSGGNPVSMAAFTPDGKHVAFYCWTWRGGYVPKEPEKPITHYDYQLMLWDVGAKKELGWPAAAQVAPALVHFHQGMFTGRPYLYTREDISDDKGRAASKTFTMTDITTNKTTPRIALDKDDDRVFDVTPDAKHILVMTAGQNPRLVEVATGKSGRSFGGHKRLVTVAALSRDGKLVVTASGRQVDGYTAAKLKAWPPDVGPTEVRIHDLATGELVAAYANDALFDFTYVGFSPDAKYVWAQTSDYELLLWGKFPPLPADVKVNWPVDPKQPAAPAVGGVKPPPVPFDLPVSDALDKLAEALPKSGRPLAQQIDALFLAALGRFPTADEQKRVAAALGDKPTAEKLRAVLAALAKTPEFEAHAKTLQKRLPAATPAFPTFPPGFSGPFTPGLSGFPQFPETPKKP